MDFISPVLEPSENNLGHGDFAMTLGHSSANLSFAPQYSLFGKRRWFHFVHRRRKNPRLANFCGGALGPRVGGRPSFPKRPPPPPSSRPRQQPSSIIEPRISKSASRQRRLAHRTSARRPGRRRPGLRLWGPSPHPRTGCQKSQSLQPAKPSPNIPPNPARRNNHAGQAPLACPAETKRHRADPTAAPSAKWNLRL